MDATEKFEDDMKLTHALLVATREQLTATLEQPATKAREARDAQITCLLAMIVNLELTIRVHDMTIYLRRQ